VGIVMTTVPLAAVGVIPGLLIFNQPFGFTSMLGVIALIGIVVNNAIILIDLTDAKRGEGLALDAAIRGAVEERIRPILLTAGTTIAGMVPLLFSSSSLWPPFAGSIISGLAASTVLTILVVPAMYRLMFARPVIRRRGVASRAAIFLCALALPLIGISYPVSAQSAGGVTFADIVDGARANAASRAAALDAAAADRGLAEARRSALLPALSVEGEVLRRNEALTVPSPAGGSIEEAPDWEGQVAAVLSQPVFDLALQVGEPAVRSAAVRTAAAQAREVEETQILEALFRALDVVDIDSAIEAASISGDALRAQYERVTRLVDGGRAIQSDADRIEIALLQVESDLRTFVLRREVVADDLGRLIGRERSMDVPSPSLIARIAEGAARLYRDSPYHGDDASWRQRSDLVALGSVIEETIATERSIHFQRLPSVEAQLRGINVLNSALEQDYWVEAALLLRWAPYARGARVAAADRVRQLRLATEERYTGAIEAVEVELHQRSVDFEIALDRYRVQERSLQLAERLEAETAQLFEAGRRTSTDYVEAQAEVRRERTARDQAATQTIRTFFAWRRSRGLEIVPQELIDLE
ncbi:MAG: efflux RND transporter permease subunit, partial [Spirochaetales bacterium]|nr:efflux RND transporter permease subunit [Spirochaetales bacterium]